MKAILLVTLCLMQDPSPVIEYRDGKVSPVSRAVANRPMQTLPETSRQLTQQQWAEIRIATLEAEVLRLQTRVADERLASLIRDAKAALKVHDSWLFSVEMMRFEAPKENK